MPKENKSDKIITIALAIIITVAAITIIYVSLPQNEENKSSEESNGQQSGGNQTGNPVILTVKYGDEQLNYTFSQLENMTSYTGIGGKINKKIVTTGPYNYTGVKISTILNQIADLPATYNITTTSSDNYTQEYSYDEVQGKIMLYNETRVQTGISNLTMIIAYKQEGEYLDPTEDGPLMIVFVDDYYTDSATWAKMLTSLEITEI